MIQIIARGWPVVDIVSRHMCPWCLGERIVVRVGAIVFVHCGRCDRRS